MIPIEYIEKRDDAHLKEILIRESSQQLPLNNCNWSAVILYSKVSPKPQFDLILHFSHVVADGLSMINLVQEIMAHIEQQISGQEKTVLTQPLYDSVEHYLTQKLTIKEFLDAQGKNRESCTPIQLQALPVGNRNSIPYIQRTIEQSLLEKITNIAKSEKVSLNSTLNASLLLAYREMTNQSLSLSFGFLLELKK